MDEQTFDLKAPRRVFSRIGFSLAVILALGTLVQLALSVAAVLILGPDSPVLGSSGFVWLMSFLPLYLVAIPVGLLMMRRLPSQAPEQHKLGGMNGFVFFLICVFLMYAGNLVGTILSLLLSGGEAVNAVAELAMDNHPLKVLFMVVLAPLLEELVFRRQIIDRTRCYGEKTAAMLSAVAFGLIHQNLFQFFYAFALGLVFAYIYLRTGRLRYTVIFHAIINFMGSVLAPAILTLPAMEQLAVLDPNMPYEELMAFYMEVLPQLLAILGYSMTLIGMFIAGLVLFIIKVRRLLWKDASMPLPAGTAFKTVYLNAGMVLFMLLCCVMFVISLL